jgi:multiple sugar transport system substrate-binding protein
MLEAPWRRAQPDFTKMFRRVEARKKTVAVTLVCTAALAAISAGAAIARSSKPGVAALNIYGYGPGDDVQENRAAYAASRLSGTNINRPAGEFNDHVFRTRLASSDIPDLVRMTRPSVAEYGSKGFLRPVDSCVRSVKRQYRAGPMRAMTYKGHTYGLPEFTNPVTLIVNRAAFEAAGVPVSAAQTTNKAKLLATAKKLTRFDSSGNLRRIGFDPKIDSSFGFPLWVKWFGDDIISRDGLHARLNTPHAVAALTYAVKIIKAEGGWTRFKAFRDTWDLFGKQNPLVKNQLGFAPTESFIYNQLSIHSPNVDLLAKLFTNREGDPITFFSGDGWVIPKGSKNTAAACEYMRAVTSVGAWVTAARKRLNARRASGSAFTGLYTANAGADRKISKDVDRPSGHRQLDQAVQTLVHTARYGFELPPTPGGRQFVAAWTGAIERALAGRQTPKAALDEAQREAQRAIDHKR